MAKTGTTYLQRVLHQNRGLLRQHGVLYPGEGKAAQFLAALDLRQASFHGHTYPGASGAWTRLSQEVNTHRGAAVVSHETLARCSEEQVTRAVTSFGSADVRVVITARDLGRQIPAVWQERIKNRGQQPYAEFLSQVLASCGEETRSHPFWLPQWLPGLVERWSAAVGMERCTVVTVPPSAADPLELWRRFVAAVGLPDAPYDMTISGGNTSLGVVEAELLRRLNARLGDLEWPRYETLVKRRFAEVTLGRVGGSQRITVPADRQAQVADVADEMIVRLKELGVTVVGDLDDLRPRMEPGARLHEVTDADLLELTSRLVLDAALAEEPEPSRPTLAARIRRRLDLRSRAGRFGGRWRSA